MPVSAKKLREYKNEHENLGDLAGEVSYLESILEMFGEDVNAIRNESLSRKNMTEGEEVSETTNRFFRNRIDKITTVEIDDDGKIVNNNHFNKLCEEDASFANNYYRYIDENHMYSLNHMNFDAIGKTLEMIDHAADRFIKAAEKDDLKFEFSKIANVCNLADIHLVKGNGDELVTDIDNEVLKNALSKKCNDIYKKKDVQDIIDKKTVYQNLLSIDSHAKDVNKDTIKGAFKGFTAPDNVAENDNFYVAWMKVSSIKDYILKDNRIRKAEDHPRNRDKFDELKKLYDAGLTLGKDFPLEAKQEILDAMNDLKITNIGLNSYRCKYKDDYIKQQIALNEIKRDMGLKPDNSYEKLKAPGKDDDFYKNMTYKAPVKIDLEAKTNKPVADISNKAPQKETSLNK